MRKILDQISCLTGEVISDVLKVSSNRSKPVHWVNMATHVVCRLNHWMASPFYAWITSSSVKCQPALMSNISVSSCVTPVWIYGPAACSCVISADLGCTSTQECLLIAYQRGSIAYLTYCLFAQTDGFQAHSGPLGAAFPSVLITQLVFVTLGGVNVSFVLREIKRADFHVCRRDLKRYTFLHVGSRSWCTSTTGLFADVR